jgi:hypothetical protein
MTAMPVKSLIARPAESAVLPGGSVLAQGVAWSGGAAVKSVEISLDDGQNWEQAELFGPETPYGWRQWRHRLVARRPGKLTIMARATDANGQTQPLERSPWNPSGYLWNAADTVTVTIQEVRS